MKGRYARSGETSRASAGGTPWVGEAARDRRANTVRAALAADIHRSRSGEQFGNPAVTASQESPGQKLLQRLDDHRPALGHARYPCRGTTDDVTTIGVGSLVVRNRGVSSGSCGLLRFSLALVLPGGTSCQWRQAVL